MQRFLIGLLLLASFLPSFLALPVAGAERMAQTAVPVIKPWAKVPLDPDHAGAWGVAGDLDGDGAV